MRRIDLKNVLLKGLQGCLLLFILLACQKVKPEHVSIPEYPDLEEFYLSQARSLEKSALEKTVSLEGQRETNTFEMDTTEWKEELSFFKEMNPDQSEYVGVFNVKQDNVSKTLSIKEGENGILKKLALEKDGKSYSSISATVHEDKDVYIHHREIEVILENGLIKSFEIKGYQKMLFKDTVRFGISGRIIE